MKLKAALCVGIILVFFGSWATLFSPNFAHAVRAQPTDGAPIGSWRSIEIAAKGLGEENNSDGSMPTIKVGSLQLRSALVLNADDKLFGGLSGLRLNDAGTKLYSISDRAQWLVADIDLDDHGAIADVTNGQMADMMQDIGIALHGMAGDAEAIELTEDGGMIVGFERYHRLDHYAREQDGRFSYRQRILHNRLVTDLANNGSLESVVKLRDDRILTISEAAIEGDAKKRNLVVISPKLNWYQGGDEWQRHYYQTTSDEFGVTDLAADPITGDIYALERAYSVRKGVRVRVKRFHEDDLVAGELIAAPEELASLNLVHGIDNMEGLAFRNQPDGRKILYMISDDNYNLTQRTVLMSWEIVD